MRRILYLAFAALALAGPAGAQSQNSCAPDTELEYICGLEKPEDFLAIPNTGWVIASGFSVGAGINLIDAKKREFRKWYTGTKAQLRWNKKRYPHCLGPLDPAVFNARGMSLRFVKGNQWQLLVVNHGGRESIEAFDIYTGQEEPRLVWLGCLPMPSGQVANSVASFADGTILTTVLTRPGTTIGDFMLGRNTGAVWQWRPGEAEFTMLAGTELPGNNGLETDRDEQHFYVVAFGLHAVAIFNRQDTSLRPEMIVAPDFMPDNIHWSEGRLLLAGMRLDEPACGGLRKVINGKADPMLCHRGWVVGELDLARRRIATVSYGKAQPGFNGHSAAALHNGQLWLGSFQSSRLAIVKTSEGNEK